MKPNIHTEFVVLEQQQLLRIRAVLGRAVTCIRGSVWLTQEADVRDIVLSAGERFELDRAGVALALALGGEAVLALDHGLDFEVPRAALHAVHAKAGTLASTIDALDLSYDPAEVAAMPIGVRNAIVQCEARRLRAEAMGALLRHTVRRVGTLARRFAMRPLTWLLGTGVFPWAR